MRPTLQFLIACLIALALPVQGMVGASLAPCGPGHERIAGSAPSMDEAHATHATVAHPCHPEHAAPAPATTVAQPTLDKPNLTAGAIDDVVEQLGQHHCSSCAACGVGSALPSDMPRLPAADCGTTDFAEAMVTVAPFATDGPDRPPRR